jgi:hypothetical protein
VSEVKLKHFGLARVQAIKTLEEDNWKPSGEVELFITGWRVYLSSSEAHAIGEALLAEARVARGDDSA